MIKRATAIDLISRGVGKYYNDGRRPMIRFTMSEGLRRREVAKLIESEGICPTCMEDYECPVAGRPWSRAEEATMERKRFARWQARKRRAA